MKITDVFHVAEPVCPAFVGAKHAAINPSLIIGLELEIEKCSLKSESAYTRIAKKNHFNVTSDGSLRGDAYEFISLPMPTEDALGATESFLREAEFTEDNYSDRCSIHVHVNCTNLDVETVHNVCILYTVVEEILFEYVGRDRDTNIFCIPWNQCRQHLDLVAGFLTHPENMLRNWNKYTATNLIPLRKQGTMEFRQMHGTADMDKITQWVNIIGAIFLYASKIELNNLITQIKELNTTSHYEMFFNEVLGGQLPYNNVYAQKLEEGVVFAKYSLMSYKEGMLNKTTAKKPQPKGMWEQVAPPPEPNLVRRREFDVAMMEDAGEGNAAHRELELLQRLNVWANRVQNIEGGA